MVIPPLLPRIRRRLHYFLRPLGWVFQPLLAFPRVHIVGAAAKNSSREKHSRVGVWREEEETLLSPFSFLPPFPSAYFILIKYQQSKYQSTSYI